MVDPGEALKLRWIDLRDNIVTINHPVRGHNPRQIKVSNKLISMLNALPQKEERIFPTTYDSIAKCYRKVRKKVARTLQNPRIKNITFTTFRHWGATYLYHHTKDILLVKKLLGHKNIKNTLKYTQLIDFEGDEYQVATATTLEEIKDLVSTGYQKVDELKGVHIFRKPKRYIS